LFLVWFCCSLFWVFDFTTLSWIEQIQKHKEYRQMIMLNYPVSFLLNVKMAVLFVCNWKFRWFHFMFLLEIVGYGVDGIIFLRLRVTNFSWLVSIICENLDLHVFVLLTSFELGPLWTWISITATENWNVSKKAHVNIWIFWNKNSHPSCLLFVCFDHAQSYWLFTFDCSLCTGRYIVWMLRNFSHHHFSEQSKKIQKRVLEV